MAENVTPTSVAVLCSTYDEEAVAEIAGIIERQLAKQLFHPTYAGEARVMASIQLTILTEGGQVVAGELERFVFDMEITEDGWQKTTPDRQAAS